MDIFEQIRNEHKEVQELLLELSKGYDKQLVKRLRGTLAAHMNAEEGSLYSALEEQESGSTEGALAGHKEIRRLAGLLIKGGPDEFPPKAADLAEALNAHFQAEEEVLGKARQTLDQEKIDVLTYQFAQINRRMRESVL
jgi:hemerythrin superfamily protein